MRSIKRFADLPAMVVLLALGYAIAAPAADQRAYDPLAVVKQTEASPRDFTVRDEARNRDIPIRVYLPAATTPAAVVLFSHGLGGSREASPYLGKHWSARGYAAVFLQHPGSDTSVWRDAPLAKRMDAMRQAAGASNLLLRVRDVPVVLEQLERWNKTAGHALAGRLDLRRVGMSGHSFGAITSQAVGGQSLGGAQPFTDKRIAAALMMSPSSPRVGEPASSFSHVKIPWMLMTGTNDVSTIGNIDVASRLAVFPALPKGSKYELVLDKAEHSAFSDRGLPGDRQRRNPNHHRVILALSTAFWDAYLRDDAAAKAWLDGKGPASVLESNDRWQKK